MHGGAPGFEAANAVLRQDRLWGGRPDNAGEMYIGAQFAQPQVVDCAFVRQNNNDEHVSSEPPTFISGFGTTRVRNDLGSAIVRVCNR